MKIVLFFIAILWVICSVCIIESHVIKFFIHIFYLACFVQIGLGMLNGAPIGWFAATIPMKNFKS
jgi:hypothetical protein